MVFSKKLNDKSFSQSCAEFFAEFREVIKLAIIILRNSAFHLRDSA